MRPAHRGILGWVGLPIALLLSATPADPAAKARAVVQLVRDRFHDAATAHAWARADPIGPFHNEAELDVALRRSLGRLKASHTAYYTVDDPEYHALRSIFQRTLGGGPAARESIGLDTTPEGFVRVALAGGPAAQAGLRRGDRIVSADGQPFRPVASFRGRAGQPVTLQIQRRAHEPPRAVVVVPRTIEPAQEWLEAQRAGTRLIPTRGKTVAFVPFHACAGSAYQELLQEEITDRLAAADALVLDFRDGWGGCDPGFVNLFNRAPARLEQVGRDGAVGQFDRQWRKPLILLINGGSRSGKEVVAHSVRKHGLGRLVGERTAGAVLAGQPFLLDERSLLYLAVADVRVDGERLEGRGVSPDIAVPDTLEFAAGADPQLDRALEVAASAR